MKTLQRKTQPAKAKLKKPEPRKKRVAAAPVPEGFTARELDAAEQLLHLSESSVSSGTARGATGHGHDVSSAASGSSSSSPRSVNAPPAPGGCLPRPFPSPTDFEEEDEREVAGRQRRTSHYRSIAEIYDTTEEIGGCSGHKMNKKE